MRSKTILWLVPLALLAACDASDSDNSYRKNALSAGTAAMVADSSASTDNTLSINSPERKVIRTADLRCKVRNVLTATTQLEDLARSAGGIVQESHLENTGPETKTSFYSQDSLRRVQIYTTTATVTLRIPCMMLDSVVNAIPAMTCFIDSRSVKQEDVTYRYMNNELKNKVGDNATTISRSMQLAKKSSEPIAVQQYDDHRQEQKIDRKIENMQLMDNVSYATLTVALSQPEQVFVQTVENADYAARTPLLLQCKAAALAGWDYVMTLAIGLITIWPLLLLLTGAYLFRRKIRTSLHLAPGK